MKEAVAQAKLAAKNSEIPIGAAITHSSSGELIYAAHNQVEALKDPTAHAEILAIRSACQALNSKNLSGYSIYVTLEPCLMCCKAISLARLDNIYFGAYDKKYGSIEHGVKIFQQEGSCNHIPHSYGGIEEHNCSNLLKQFFQNKRG